MIVCCCLTCSCRQVRKSLFDEAIRWALRHVLAPGLPFSYAPEMHVLLHTSTAKPSTVYGNKLAKHFADNQLVHLTFEGPGGDPRAGPVGKTPWYDSTYLVPANRTIVVPYFIESAASASQWLARWCSFACATTRQALHMAGMGGHSAQTRRLQPTPRLHWPCSLGRIELRWRRLGAAGDHLVRSPSRGSLPALLAQWPPAAQAGCDVQRQQRPAAFESDRRERTAAV